jgi:cytochrome c oxidase subunit III
MQSDVAIADKDLKRSENAGGGIPFGGEDNGLPGRPEIPRRAYTTATLLVLASISMFFAALISASVVRKGSPSGDWRPLSVPRILWLNTAILLASSVTLARARSSFLKRSDDEFRHWWRITAILGGFFVVGQFIAWRQLAAAGIYLTTNPAGSFFYTLTAAHALHLAVGLFALLLVAFRKPRRIPSQTAIDMIGLYWHFMDAVWVFLFFFLLVT